MKRKASLTRNSVNCSSCHCGTTAGLLIQLFLAFACFALSATVRGVTPAPDGGYPNRNTAEGDNALLNLSVEIGVDNTALGFDALLNDVTGSRNTAVGSGALQSNTSSNNTATGFDALFNNTTGANNVADGDVALLANTTGGGNTAIGANALSNNTIGSNNTSAGFDALQVNTTGSGNTAEGSEALLFNFSGSGNTANGFSALISNEGSNNVAVGQFALANNTSGNSNIAIGESAGTNLTTGSNNIDIGNDGVAGESKTIRVGTSGTHTKTVIAGIFGTTVVGGVGVIVGSGGRLGTVVSSARFKEEVKPMGKASKAILALKPVTFRYKHELDPEGIRQFGLVAEQVEKINPDLVVCDEQGKPYSVRYEAVNAMLLNEFLKEHRHGQEQDAIIAKQQKQIEALTAGLQRVSARLEPGKTAPQMVNNP